MSIKVMVVFGTRPEAIKMAPLCNALKMSSDIELKVCVTAQHRQMLDQVTEIFSIKPDIDLNIMREGQDLTDVTSSVILAMRDKLLTYQPDILLVHGDTTTSFAASISAYYLSIPVGHVEAGLRTYDIWSPYPEEFNRQVVSKIATLHFAPTKSSKENLLRENVSDSDIYVTGNTVIDSLYWIIDKIERNDENNKRVTNELANILKFNFKKERYLLITGHRRENFGKRFNNICYALSELANMYPNIQFVYPVHLNPNVQGPVNKLLGNLKNIHLLNPLNYEMFVYLLKYSYLILTDSGGIQEEAPSLGKPVLVMRDLTERPEAVESGTVRLVGANKDMIISGVRELLDEEEIYQQMARAHNPYGDGNAVKRIIKIIKEVFHEKLE